MAEQLKNDFDSFLPEATKIKELGMVSTLIGINIVTVKYLFTQDLQVKC